MVNFDDPQDDENHYEQLAKSDALKSMSKHIGHDQSSEEDYSEPDSDVDDSNYDPETQGAIPSMKLRKMKKQGGGGGGGMGGMGGGGGGGMDMSSIMGMFGG